MPSATPTVSVMMPAHDAASYVDDAVRSILEQTMPDLELVILDDASTDGTTEALREWAKRDDRIRLFESSENVGLTPAGNFVLERCRGRFITRMDADDVSHPDRLRREVEVLETHPEAAAVAGLWTAIDRNGKPIRPRDRWRLLRGKPFAPFPHSTVMASREVFEKAGPYRDAWYWEDFDLYLRLQRVGPILVIPDALLTYRIHPASTRIIAEPYRFAHALDLLDRCVAEFREGRDYADLLEAPMPDPPERFFIPPRLFFIYTFAQIWSGEPSKTLGTLVENRVYPTSPSRVALWFLTAISVVAPRLFRSILAAGIRIRDLVASAFMGREPVPWQFE